MSVDGAAARRLALEVLARIEDDGAYANLALSPALERAALERRDRSLVTDLVYGTTRMRRACDHLIGRFVATEPPPSARRALRLGAYQLEFREDIPAYAAVASTVEASPKRFRPLVNAVLRKIAAAAPDFPDEATRLSYPDWVVDRLSSDLGADTALAALEAMNDPPKVTTRADGYVQDEASQAIVDLAGVRTGDVVVDLCAAPGGKATGLAGAGGFVVAGDLRPSRLGLVSRNARNLGLDAVAPVLADAAAPPFRRGATDVVLLDAPCSGLGVLRRRADARWRLDAASVERLAELQRRLVDVAAELVAPGGTLVYSVCTLTAAESLGVDDHLRRTHPELMPCSVPDEPWQPWGRGAILLPQAASTDGMCLLRYRRPTGGDVPGDRLVDDTIAAPDDRSSSDGADSEPGEGAHGVGQRRGRES